MIEIRRISKNQLWAELDDGLLNAILFGGSRLTCVDEVLAAYENDTFAGAVTLSPVGEMNARKPSIVGLLVLKEWRRKGIGIKLMESAVT
jgi:GNAT superfamily N-acetyltransferase